MTTTDTFYADIPEGTPFGCSAELTVAGLVIITQLGPAYVVPLGGVRVAVTFPDYDYSGIFEFSEGSEGNLEGPAPWASIVNAAEAEGIRLSEAAI